jgi:CrcB protein
MLKVTCLFVAGGLGALARYWLGGFIQQRLSWTFPIGTLGINLLGCLAFGVFWTLGERLVISRETRFLILTGFMGAFTTFSTFAFETTFQLRDADVRNALINVTAHLVLGLVGIVGGMSLGQVL